MEKKCLSKCPECNADVNDIDWGEIQVDGRQAWQEAHCNKCECDFNEVYRYIKTELA